ncbi:hypothetical protein [Actinomadura sp. 9N407]|uniref:hypothetical protein n=1 Tax=Actinomadura sp. 9N407 TaxID=3375154 RepID=UPI00379FFF50
MFPPGPGHWDVHVAVTALGLSREARLGGVRGPKLKTAPQRHTLGAAGEATAHFTNDGHLAVLVESTVRPATLRSRLRRLFGNG